MANTAIIVALICVSLIGTLVLIGLVAGGTLALIFLDFSSNTQNSIEIKSGRTNKNIALNKISFSSNNYYRKQ